MGLRPNRRQGGGWQAEKRGRGHIMRLGLIAVNALLLTAAAPLQARSDASATTPDGGAQADKCRALVGRSFGDKVRITAASRVPAAAAGTVAAESGPPIASALPAYCRVEGTINQRIGAGGKSYGIGFALALPEAWSGRFLLQGGGGLNGSVHPPFGAVAAGATPALARGFAVISHDSGHKGAVFDASFMADQRAALDFAESAVRVVTEVGKAITVAYYGSAIAHSYMAGCSTGGREGMLASQRYPELFDGIIVGAPAMRPGYSNLATAYSAVQFNQAAPRDAQGKPIVANVFSASDRALILKGLLDQCDGADGLRDGMIMNVAQCHFQPAKLRCARGKAETCLSQAQVDALDRAFAGPKDKAGYAIYAPVAYDTGIVDTNGPIPGYLPTGAPGVFGPANRDLTIDLDARVHELRADAGAGLTDTNVWTSLGTFLGHGGKMLFFHGVSDPWFSAFDTWDYWQRAKQANGAAWDGASRFYMIPGMGHCGGGNAFDQFDLLSPLVDWVEHGKPPETIVASRRLPAKGERPMCAYPAYPHYIGGDEKAASSFACRSPASLALR
jgi:feruloyl esterase